MYRSFSKRYSAHSFRRLAASLLLVHLLLAVVLSVTPDLHALVHAHSHDEGHACAITQFQAGTVIVVDDPLPFLAKAITWVELGAIVPLVPKVESIGLRESPLGRAPPVLG